MKILHLTDLHIDSEEKNKLRPHYYDEFLKPLVILLKTEEITHLFITGDLINRGKTEVLDHAKRVIDHLTDTLGIDRSNTYIINGNHDVRRGSKNFDEFYRKIPDYTSIGPESNWFRVISDGLNLFVLMNSVRENIDSGLPCQLSTPDIDAIIAKIKSSIQDDFNGNIFLLSHHPAIVNNIHNHSPFDESDGSWVNNHIWNSAAPIKFRLSGHYPESKIYWLSGDVHQPESFISGNFHNLIGASLIGTGAIPTRGTILDTNNAGKSKSLTYTATSINDSIAGEWNINELKTTLSTTNTQPSPNQASPKNAPSSTTVKTQNYQQERKFKLICKSFQDEINSAIFESDAYKFGRFETNKRYTSLAWVATNSLFNHGNIFNMIIQNLITAIEDIKSNTIIIGIGPWGGIIAARIASLYDIKYAVMAPNNREDSYEECELFNMKIKEIIKCKTYAVTVSDVISTGETASWIEKELMKCGKNVEHIRHLSILIGDTDKIEKVIDADIKYLCESVKLPTIEQCLLPPRSILRSNVFYHD